MVVLLLIVVHLLCQLYKLLLLIELIIAHHQTSQFRFIFNQIQTDLLLCFRQFLLLIGSLMVDLMSSLIPFLSLLLFS